MSRYIATGTYANDEADKYRQATLALNEEAKLNWDNPEWHKEQAALLTENTYEGFEHENIISYLSDVRRIGWEDRATISEVRGLKAFWVARGAYIDESTIREDVFTVEREKIGFHVSDFEEKVEANFGQVSRSVVDLGVERLDAELNKWFLSAVQAAVDSGDANYHAASGLSLSTVIGALSAVRDATRSREVTIVGRSQMTDQFVHELLGGTGSNGTGFIPGTNEDMVRTGLLGTYMGANIVSLKNYTDDNDVPFIPANELYVVAKDASRTFFFGTPRSRQWTEEANDYWHYKYHLDCGMVIHRPERIHRVVDSSIAP